MLTDRIITVWSDVKRTKCVDTTVGAFLASKRHRATVDKIRSTENKTVRDELKKLLPQAAIAGTFENGCKMENFAEPSGLMCIDIDAKDNPTVDDWEQLKSEISSSKFVAYVGLSASGHGLWGIIPIAYPDAYREQFLAAEADFLSIGITLDHGYVSPAHLRAWSYDDNAYLNENAREYTKRKRIMRPVTHGQRDKKGTLAEVDRLCKVISEARKDITAGYDNWMSLAASLATLGEDGRAYYHILSEQNPRYNPYQTDRKFDNWLYKGEGKYSIRTFFSLAHQAGFY